MEGEDVAEPKFEIRRKGRGWSWLSPARLLRVFCDTYVKGCVTFGNSSKVTAVAQATAFQLVGDDVFLSRSNSRQAGNRELLDDFSGKFSRQGPAHGAGGVSPLQPQQSGPQQHQAVITGHQGLTMADLQGYTGTIRVRPSFDAVPESEQYTDTDVSKVALEALFQSSALRPTEFLTRKDGDAAALESGFRSFALRRGGSERVVPHPRAARFFSPSVNSHSTLSTTNPLMSPVADLSSRHSCNLPRGSSRRRDSGFAAEFAGSAVSLSGSPAPLVHDYPKSRSKKVSKPNPYREYDTRIPSTVVRASPLGV